MLSRSSGRGQLRIRAKSAHKLDDCGIGACITIRIAMCPLRLSRTAVVADRAGAAGRPCRGRIARKRRMCSRVEGEPFSGQRGPNDFGTEPSKSIDRAVLVTALQESWPILG